MPLQIKKPFCEPFVSAPTPRFAEGRGFVRDPQAASRRVAARGAAPAAPRLAAAPPPQYSIDPLVRVAELQALLLRTTAADDTTYDAF